MTQESPEPLAPVIVIDVQSAMVDGVVCDPIPDAANLVARLLEVLGWARRGGRPVAFVRHDAPPGDVLAPGEPGWPVARVLEQSGDEPTFSKTVGDAFSDPALRSWVEALGVGEVILLGAETENCVAATVRGAMERGLAVTVVSDAHGTWGFRAGGQSPSQIIERHNRLFEAAGARVVSVGALVDA